MYSHSLKKFLKETLHFSGCWLFLRKWNNEKIVILPSPPLPHIILTPQKYKKTLCPTKFWQIFKLSNQNNYQTMLRELHLKNSADVHSIRILNISMPGTDKKWYRIHKKVILARYLFEYVWNLINRKYEWVKILIDT